MGGDLPTRSFVAFTIALAISVWALFADVGRPYLPSVPIVVYGIFLYANRDAIAHTGSDSLRDSPYFLGFLLTMFGLFKLFNDVSFNFSLFGRNPALLTEQVGAAVLTTIIGLFVRQALLLLVPDTPPKEDDRLASLANAVTSHAVAFELARQEFFRDMAAERERHVEALEDLHRRFGPISRRDVSATDAPAVAPALRTASRTPGPAAPIVDGRRDDGSRDVTDAPVASRAGTYSSSDGPASPPPLANSPVPPVARFQRDG